MTLIADGGSTTVDWRLIDAGLTVKQVITGGLNPYFRNFEEINKEIKNCVLPEFKGYLINSLYFFGAGCSSDENQEIIRKSLANNFDVKTLKISSDLMGAAIGLCGNNAGIVCILGTGSNSCFYDGKNIVENIPSLGFILGDEGSGAVLGRLFLNACLKNQLTKGLKEKFLEEFNLTVPIILDKVYKQQKPNTFLGTITYFLKENLNDESVYNLIYGSFADFFRKNVMQYEYLKHKVYFTGSVSYLFKDVLIEVADCLNITIGAVLQNPMDGLINFYSKM